MRPVCDLSSRPLAHGRCWVSEDRAEWLEGDPGSDLYIRTNTHMALTPNPPHREVLTSFPRSQSPPTSSRASTARKPPRGDLGHPFSKRPEAVRGTEGRGPSHGQQPIPLALQPPWATAQLRPPGACSSRPRRIFTDLSPVSVQGRLPRSRSAAVSPASLLFPAHSHIPKGPSHLLSEALNRPSFKAQHSRAWLWAQRQVETFGAGDEASCPAVVPGLPEATGPSAASRVMPGRA